MEELHISPEYNEEAPVIDMEKVSFPILKSLSMICQPIKSIHFTKKNTPILSSLDIESTLVKVEKFHLDLPELTYMGVQFVTVCDPRGFGKSLSRSPKLESFMAYKLWGLHVPKSKAHVLVLPNCQTLDLYRSDDLNYLQIWAPKLEELDLQAVYSITEVKILDCKPNGYAGPEYNFEGIPSQYEVNIINTEIPAGNVTVHPRCKKVLRNSDELGFF